MKAAEMDVPETTDVNSVIIYPDENRIQIKLTAAASTV
jgi:hypothetical protein